MVIQITLQLENHNKLNKMVMVTIEKIEWQIIYNLAFLPMKTKKLELKEVMTGETLENFKLQVEIGMLKSI
jgi:hypothetical protein